MVLTNHCPGKQQLQHDCFSSLFWRERAESRGGESTNRIFFFFLFFLLFFFFPSALQLTDRQADREEFVPYQSKSVQVEEPTCHIPQPRGHDAAVSVWTLVGYTAERGGSSSALPVLTAHKLCRPSKSLNNLDYGEERFSSDGLWNRGGVEAAAVFPSFTTVA